MKFEDIKYKKNIFLYCGDLQVTSLTKTGINFIGLSLHRNDRYHINHDITKKIDLLDNSVDIVQSEDVMEHIEYDILPSCINDIYRILKPGGLFRLSMPDYCCDVLYNRSVKDKNGNIIFDAGGGGNYDEINKKVINGGHLWFPKYKLVKELIEKTNFENDKVEFLHYYDNEKKPILKNINYKMGYIRRTPDNDERVMNPRRPMSIVLDCYK